ncbi:NAD-dependent epimerase/dehydratase family protein [Flavobacteriaceae bacterium TK19130]|nr:NAD-dependent epimerase/dehydratase family protein [Thermobacterium salinum]
MIVVTGGTGLVGSHLLYSLIQKHGKVRALHRKDSDLEAVRKVFSYYSENANLLFDKIEWIPANILDIPALTEALDGATYVYHAAAYVSFDPSNYKKLKKANVEGTANIVNICLKKDVKKLCYVSSVATLGSAIEGALITEETHWNPEEKNSVYAITKYGAEMEVWRGTQEGLPAVIVNPGVILGEGFWHSSSGVIVKMASKGISRYPSGSVGIVDVKDLVRAMTKLMESDIVNNSYILVAENMSYKKLLTMLSKALRQSPPKRQLPYWLLSLISTLDGVSAFLFGTKRRLPKATVRSLYTKSFYDASKSKTDVDFDYTPVRSTIERVAAQFLEESTS